MSSLALLRTLFGYRAWANAELLEKMKGFDTELHAQDREAALRLLNHTHVVDRIFAAHLVGAAHEFTSDNTAETPSLEALRGALTTSDQWYRDYLETVTPEELAAHVPFVFTDGDKGCMSREEMLTHLIVHSGYHRGEVGRIMSRRSLSLAWDTFAVYLHQTEPSRRFIA
ncbi:DinB family protein [Xylophilus sp. ASV27]|uniref:DinB family protein n=1 Tax=Xylophilus sp. ASV27 TaxID=2795129 RepID=UPI0018EB2699|nr:DinB family protein [Xylophilus sp. ASV27]